MPDLQLWFGSENSRTSIKDTVLTVRTFSVEEKVSGLFDVAIMAMTHDPDIDFETIVGQPAGFRIQTGILHASGGQRHWKGICRFIEQIRVETSTKGLSTYQLTIVPSLWRLTQRRGYRIFQHQTIPDIIDRLLGEWSIKPIWQITRGAYPKLEYRVQYGETDYAFFCRLLEEAGIAFTFPDDGLRGSELTLSDALTSGERHKASPIHFVNEPSEAAQREFVTRVHMSQGVRPGAFTLRDHSFRNPDYAFLVEAPRAKEPENLYEQYHVRPGALLFENNGAKDTPVADDKGVARHDEAKGRALATRELAAERSGRRQITFETNVIDLLPGAVFTMENHPHPVLATAHPLLVMEFFLNGSQGGDWSMSGRAYFTEDAFAPACVTPRPKVHGMESAVVVGPAGEEIYVDEFGRVRVQFQWDREGKRDDNASCWLRVSQGWAGMGYGSILIPRVGQEVLVGFLGGDPEQPIIVGRVYNGKNKVPFTLPEHKTVSAWRSASTPGGNGFNEIRFDDKKGNELVNVQAERDLSKLVKHDESEVTRGHHGLLVGGDQDIVVKGSKKEHIEGDSHLIAANRSTKIEGRESLTVTGSRHENVQGRYAVEGGGEIRLQAGESLTIKGPGGFIRIDQMGITIQGTVVNINCAGVDTGIGPSPKQPIAANAPIDNGGP